MLSCRKQISVQNLVNSGVVVMTDFSWLLECGDSGQCSSRSSSPEFHLIGRRCLSLSFTSSSFLYLLTIYCLSFSVFNYLPFFFSVEVSCYSLLNFLFQLTGRESSARLVFDKRISRH